MNILSLVTGRKVLIILACLLNVSYFSYVQIGFETVGFWEHPAVGPLYVLVTLWFLAVIATRKIGRAEKSKQII